MRDQFEYQRAVFASDLSTNAKITALAIASHFNWADFNPAFPGTKLLTTETGLSARSIDRAKAELKARGFLTIENRTGTSNLYVPAIPACVTQTHEEPTYVTQTQVEGSPDEATYATQAQGVRHTDVGVRHTDVGGTSQWRTNKEENKEPNNQENKEDPGNPGWPGVPEPDSLPFVSEQEDEPDASFELEEGSQRNAEALGEKDTRADLAGLRKDQVARYYDLRSTSAYGKGLTHAAALREARDYEPDVW